jgi:bis(5'-nucleosidyl)-tetraphosphatase
MPELKSCGVLIVRGEPVEQFLLMKHADRWDLPKGHVDPGETELECALRELEEETGICPADVAIDPGFVFTLQYDVQYERTGGRRQLKTLQIFLGRLKRDVSITPTEHQGYEWFDWSPPHAIQEQTIDPLLAKLAEYLEGASQGDVNG